MMDLLKNFPHNSKRHIDLSVYTWGWVDENSIYEPICTASVREDDMEKVENDGQGHSVVKKA